MARFLLRHRHEGEDRGSFVAERATAIRLKEVRIP